MRRPTATRQPPAVATKRTVQAAEQRWLARLDALQDGLAPALQRWQATDVAAQARGTRPGWRWRKAASRGTPTVAA